MGGLHGFKILNVFGFSEQHHAMLKHMPNLEELQIVLKPQATVTVPEDVQSQLACLRLQIMEHPKTASDFARIFNLLTL